MAYAADGARPPSRWTPRTTVIGMGSRVGSASSDSGRCQRAADVATIRTSASPASGQGQRRGRRESPLVGWLGDVMHGIDGGVLDHLQAAVWPSNLDQIDFGVFTEAEVGRGAALRQIPAGGLHLARHDFIADSGS